MIAFQGTRRPDPITYMAAAAATDAGRVYKNLMRTALDLQPGLRALDIGCGPGTDLDDLAAGVGITGQVFGVDLDPRMVAEARRRTTERPNVEVVLGDGDQLPVDDESVDRVRIDRVLQHVNDPAAVLTEVRRVLSPGGLVALAEPDWSTLTIDSPDPATSAAFTAYTCAEVVRNATVGRALPRLARGAELEVTAVHAVTPVFQSFGIADQILGLTRNSYAAATAGHLDERTAQTWLADLAARPVLASFILFIVTARARP